MDWREYMSDCVAGPVRQNKGPMPNSKMGHTL
jgi:hypothetical protein